MKVSGKGAFEMSKWGHFCAVNTPEPPPLAILENFIGNWNWGTGRFCLEDEEGAHYLILKQQINKNENFINNAHDARC